MIRAPFPPAARLRRPQEFAAVFRDGRRHVRAGVVVIVAPGGCGRARLGLALAKRRLPRAVDRNRVKRVVRESFRITRGDLGSVDIVVLARAAVAGMSNHRLFRQLRSVWREVAAADADDTGANTAAPRGPADPR